MDWSRKLLIVDRWLAIRMHGSALHAVLLGDATRVVTCVIACAGATCGWGNLMTTFNERYARVAVCCNGSKWVDSRGKQLEVVRYRSLMVQPGLSGMSMATTICAVPTYTDTV